MIMGICRFNNVTINLAMLLKTKLLETHNENHSLNIQMFKRNVNKRHIISIIYSFSSIMFTEAMYVCRIKSVFLNKI